MRESRKVTGASPVLEDGIYSFMNCDTGRRIELDGRREFAVESDGQGLYTLSCGRDGVVFTAGGTAGAAAGEQIAIEPLSGGRYMLLADGAPLCDDDAGATNAAHVTPAKKLDAIECCWYITPAGGVEPLRIMLVGDSITLGANTDLPEDQWWGCRPELSEALAADGKSRFVFVGSMKDHDSAMDDAALYRHEGHGGWMADDIYQINPESRGFIDYIDEFFGKYAPDLVMVQMGTNDCAFAAGKSMYEEEPYTPESMASLKARWNNFMEKMWEKLPAAGAMIVGSVPPTTRTQCFDDWINEFNTEPPVAVERYVAAGRRAVFADTNAAISAATPERGLCGDMVHLSAAGYTAMASAYIRAFAALYPDGAGK